MSVIPRYLSSIMIPYLLLAVGVFSSIIFMNQFVRIFNTAIMIGASIGWVFYSLGNFLPTVMMLSIPMAFQLAVLLTLSGMSETGELLALRAAGFSPSQIVGPFLWISLALCLLLNWVNHSLAPASIRRFYESKFTLSQKITNIKVEPKTFINLGEWRLYAENVDNSDGRMKGVHLFRYPKDAPAEDAWTMRVSAPDGRYMLNPGKGVSLVLQNGDLQRSDPKDTSRAIMARFQQYNVFMPFAVKNNEKRTYALPELSTTQIFEGVRKGDLPPQRNAEYKVEAAYRFVLALSPLVFFWVSCPLGLSMARRNKAWGFVLSICILFTYYGAMAVGMGMGKKMFSLSWYLPFLPLPLGLAAGAVLWRRMRG